jgi:membrane protease YdiL (CAAX protease family)
VPWDFILIFLILGGVVPWRGAIRVRKLLARPVLTTTDRLVLYASTIAFQWIAVTMVAWRSIARGLSFHELGLSLPHPFHTAIVTILITTAFCAFQFFGLRHAASIPPQQRGLVQQLAAKILPQNSIEQLTFSALVVTVALCEEFLYRGFAFAAIARATHQRLFAAALVSALFFAVAHLYQGRRGLISTFLIGIVFAIVRITEESLAPAIVAHLFVDLVAGLLAPRLLLRRTQVEEAAVSPPQ